MMTAKGEVAAVEAALDQLPTISRALCAVAAEVGAVGKNDRNVQQGFSFRGIDAVLNATGPILHKHGVIIIPEVVGQQWESIEVGAKRTVMRSCALTIRYRFVGPAGDHLDAIVVGESMDAGDKAASKAMSVGLRIALLQTLSLPTDDPDPDATSYERSPPPTPPRQQRANRETPLAAVLNLARRAGVEGEVLAADIAARHDGRTLADLSKQEMRAEWFHWRERLPPNDDATPTESPAELSAVTG